MRTDIRPFAQLDQDIIVLSYLNFKRDGYFVDIGCGAPTLLSNTARLEKDYNWSGIAIDINNENDHTQWSDRTNTKHIVQDATTIDYNTLFKEHFGDKDIDFLSLDLEPPQLTMDVLYKLPWDIYRPKIIAFEPDSYRDDNGPNREKEAIEFFHKLRYSLRAKLYPRLNNMLLTNCRCQDHIYVRHDVILEETNR